jgi:hypothetical protein
MSDGTEDALAQTISSVESIQNLDPQQIARTETLGRALDFSAAIPAFRKVVEFYKQIPIQFLADLPDSQQTQLRQYALEFLAIFQRLMAFDPAQSSDAKGEREGLINQVNGAHTTQFNNMYPLVSYLASRQRDLSSVEREARAVVEATKAQADQLTETMKSAEAETQRVLAEVRKTAAEAGVSQQARYFADQAQIHSDAAGDWQKYTVALAAALAVFAALSVLLGYTVLEPKTVYQALQLTIAKVLIFSTLAYLLFLSARTLLAHRHNEIVNKHRQNALLTFNALAEAASSEQTREVVLTHASACIFAPQESGFAKPAGAQTAQSLIEVLPRVMSAQQSIAGH